MERKVERERALPAFSLGLPDFAVLIERLVALFDAKDVYVSIDVTLRGEKLTFKSIEEIKEYRALRGAVTNFSVWLSAGKRHISLRSRLLFSQVPSITVVADNEAWCAGAIETAYSLLSAYRPWYSWFIAAPIGWFLIILLNVPTVAVIALPKDSKISKPELFGWLVTLLVLILLFVARSTVFPAAALRITDEESFVRKHAAELSLIIALLSAVLTVTGWFVSR